VSSPAVRIAAFAAKAREVVEPLTTDEAGEALLAALFARRVESGEGRIVARVNLVARVLQEIAPEKRDHFLENVKSLAGTLEQVGPAPEVGA
jgi:hypothetical protein